VQHVCKDPSAAARIQNASPAFYAKIAKHVADKDGFSTDQVKALLGLQPFVGNPARITLKAGMPMFPIPNGIEPGHA
jgi:hypothetical protein